MLVLVSLLVNIPSHAFAASNVEGLVAAFSFNEGNGNTATDTSSRGNQGQIFGATWTSDGKYGSALSFDGINDWVTLPITPSLTLSTGMTLEAWVYPTALSGWRTVILQELPDGLAYALYAHDDVSHPSVHVHTDAEVAAAGEASLPLNTWSHLAGTYDGTTLRLYVNGIEVRQQEVSGDIVTTGRVVRLGGNSVWGEFFEGSIDEVRIYDRVLTAAEIQTDMQTPVSVPEAPVAGFSALPALGFLPLTVDFTDSSVGSITTWFWEFGDGTTSVEQHPSHTYTMAGRYTVRLTVAGAGGSNTLTQTEYITVTSPPVANFQASLTTGLTPLPVVFTDISTGDIQSWLWDFGDGSTSTAQHPTHTYTASGAYTVRLTVAGNGGTGQATLTWKDLVNNAEEVGGYRVYYGRSSGVYTRSVEAGKQMFYTVRNLEVGQTYYFSVQAYDNSGRGESPFSSEVSTTISAQSDMAVQTNHIVVSPDTTPPAAPTKLQVSISN
jgi:PKD repeat protein